MCIWLFVVLLSLLDETSISHAFNVKSSGSFSFGSFDSTRRSSTEPKHASLESSNGSNMPLLTFDGRRILPCNILISGFSSDSKLAAVYAILTSSYQRGSPTDSESTLSLTQYVGATQDLEASLKGHLTKHGESQVAYARVQSFNPPDPVAMQRTVQEWTKQAETAGANLQLDWADDISSIVYAEEDEEDDELENDVVVSPFGGGPTMSASSATTVCDPQLEFNAENVDQVLNEVRPYLIADGGNVAVDRVNVSTRTVYLRLEGACGSCPSSTVTMKMGIERVLREKFENLGEVLEISQLEPTELTEHAVQSAMNRLLGAVTSMGGTVKLMNVDPANGKVIVSFNGPEKVRQGVKLALRDVPLVKTIEFVDEIASDAS